MKAIVLGSAAGGGYPQWNCRCPVCRLFWENDRRVRRRTQSSMAVSADGSRWVLLNCSPDIREQIAMTRALWPRGDPRGTPIVAAVLTNGDIDHIGGLLSLRESARLSVFATQDIIATIAANPVFGVLDRSLVSFEAIRTEKKFSPAPGIAVMAFEAPGKVPLYLEGAAPEAAARSGNTLGLRVSDANGKTLAYVPGCARVDERLLADLEGCDTIVFDGTLWRDDEMIATTTGAKTGRRMGHVPVSGPDGSMAALASLATPRRIFIHINNTNPLLIDGSPERAEAASQGWDVSFDGMEIEL